MDLSVLLMELPAMLIVLPFWWFYLNEVLWYFILPPPFIYSHKHRVRSPYFAL